MRDALRQNHTWCIRPVAKEKHPVTHSQNPDRFDFMNESQRIFPWQRAYYARCDSAFTLVLSRQGTSFNLAVTSEKPCFFFVFSHALLLAKERLYKYLCDVVRWSVCLWQDSPPYVELTTPLPLSQLNTVELKRLHLVCDSRIDTL